MHRNKPMKRVAFKTRSQKLAAAGFTRRPSGKTAGGLWPDPEEPREDRFPGVDIDAIHRGRYGSNEAFAPQPKFDYVRSHALMAAYRKIACQACGRNDGTVCGAHSNWAVHGKGRGVKASDIYCASLCLECHVMIDQGAPLTETERKAIWWSSHVRTLRLLVALELWPPGQAVPDIESFPF